MRVVATILAATLAMPAIAQVPDCEKLTDKIKAQQEQIFRLNVTAIAHAVPKSTANSIDTRLQTLTVVTAMQANVQVAIASKCDVRSVVIDHDPDGAKAQECGAKIGAALQQTNKGSLAAAYRFPACGGQFEELALAAEGEATKPTKPAAAPGATAPATKASGDPQDDWRKRIAAYTAKRAACRETHSDDEGAVARCAGPIPAPPR
ncbi:MAG TPA: hypothetical protein VJ890_23715 [Vineibacter sp.]|nr:hypothetical protein [Vineibacter sp.]